jgi:hypothetical protein
MPELVLWSCCQLQVASFTPLRNAFRTHYFSCLAGNTGVAEEEEWEDI